MVRVPNKEGLYSYPLEVLYFPENMTSLKYVLGYCFNNNSKLKNIYNLPNSIIYIGQYGFAQTPVELTKLPDSLKYIDSSAFYQSKIKINTLPSELTTILQDTFRECPNLNIAHFGNSIDGIQSEIDNKIIYIGRNAFRLGTSTMSQPTTIYIHSSIKELEDNCFYNYGYKDMTINYSNNGINVENNATQLFGNNRALTFSNNDTHA